MPRNKKRWIDKKNTVTYELCIRSEGEKARPVLSPIKAYGRQSVPEHMYDELNARFEEPNEEGQFDDIGEEEENFDDPIESLTKPIGVAPGAVFITPDGKVLNAQSVEAWDPEEIEIDHRIRQKKASLAYEGTLDPDIMEALDNPDDKSYEEFGDEFLRQVILGDAEGDFDDIGGGYGLDDLEGDDDSTYRSKQKQRDSQEYDSSDFEDSEEEPTPSKRNPKLVDEMFDVALNRFDEDDTLELEPEDPSIAGPSKASAFTDVFDEFLFQNSRVTVSELDTVLEKTNQPLKPYEEPKARPDDEQSEEDDSTEEWKKDLTETLSFQVKDGGWDCESIITTYSNTENHPALIAIPRKEDRIKLGLRGVPKMEHKKPDSEEEEEDKPNLGEKREKSETPEEKKARKQEVKALRRQFREDKKSNRVMFRAEEVKQRKQIATNFTRGKTIVQYSI